MTITGILNKLLAVEVPHFFSTENNPLYNTVIIVVQSRVYASRCLKVLKHPQIKFLVKVTTFLKESDVTARSFQHTCRTDFLQKKPHQLVYTPDNMHAVQ